jgi:Ca2+/Na+ antiporter
LIAAHLPHYTSADAITGSVIFIVLLVIGAVAAFRRGRR